MVTGPARHALAAARRLVWIAGLLAISACGGTEHVVFIPLDPFTVPPGPMDAAVEVVDAAPPPPPDAGPAEDFDAGAAPDPDLDRLDREITFEWNETLPGQGTCHAGSYVGSFVCEVPVEPGAVTPPYTLSGQVVFTLGSSSEQQVLAVTEGAVKDTLGLNSASLAGSLRCIDKTFAAETVAGLSWLPFAFQATLAGAFDDQALVIAGQFEMTNDAGDRCVGDFHVSAAP